MMMSLQGRLGEEIMRKQNKRSGKIPPSPSEPGTRPTPFLHLLSLSCGIRFCCCCGAFVVCLRQGLVILPCWLRTSSDTLVSLFWVLRIKACVTMPGRTMCLSVCFSGLFVEPRLASCLRPQGANSVVLSYHIASRTVHHKCSYVINKVR